MLKEIVLYIGIFSAVTSASSPSRKQFTKVFFFFVKGIFYLLHLLCSWPTMLWVSSHKIITPGQGVGSGGKEKLILNEPTDRNDGNQSDTNGSCIPQQNSSCATCWPCSQLPAAASQPTLAVCSTTHSPHCSSPQESGAWFSPESWWLKDRNPHS